MSIRENFEAWIQTTQGWKTCKKRGKPFSLRRNMNSEYADFRVNDRWHAYKAAAKPTYDETKWKLVPVEPTDAMIDAGRIWIVAEKIYKAMLAAAPMLSQSGES